MSYTSEHKDSECDKCLEDVGKENLRPMQFLFKDCNDKIHKDYDPRQPNYKLYYVCDKCYKLERGLQGNVKEKR